MPNLILKSINFFFLIFGSFLFNSCSKRGCMEKDAENYEPKATTDCSCCYFYGKARIWYGDNFYNGLKSSGTTKLIYYVNDEVVGQMDRASDLGLANYPGTGPAVSQGDSDYLYDDGEGNLMTVPLGADKEKTLPVTVKDQNGNIRWQGSATFKANQIILIQFY